MDPCGTAPCHLARSSIPEIHLIGAFLAAVQGTVRATWFTVLL
jgi:hypothetical protein